MLKSSHRGVFMKSRVIKCPKVSEFEFSIKHNPSVNPKNTIGLEQHIHQECEIYINLSGDVSFMVEDRIYPIKRGSVIITRPYEYHHCIYHSEELHEHFWILFSAKGNEALLDLFFNRKNGEDNLIILDDEKTDALIELCHTMCIDNNDKIKDYYNFFRLLSLLKEGTTPELNNSNYSRDINTALRFINNHFFENITVSQVANTSNMSVNTLERKFQKALNTRPYNYIREKRLANAVKLLSRGETVTDACNKSGFSDCSSFINLFKRTYGVTPFKYKQKSNKY